jgi:hypothetical protein
MNRIILIFFLLSGCSYNQPKNFNSLSDKNFSDNLSFEEFRIQLDEYATNSPYPNIDN